MTDATSGYQRIDSGEQRAIWRQHAVRLSTDQRVTPVRIAELLDAGRASAIAAAVLESNQYWIARAGRYATFGAASYLDAPRNRESYLSLARRYNPILSARFGRVYESVRQELQQALGAEVILADDIALPGFHVYQHLSPASQPARNAHFDLQWMHALDALPEATLSFTLPIDLSEGGGSLWVWPLRYEDVDALETTTVDYALDTAASIWNYDTGTLYLQDGFNLHSIGRAEVPVAGGRRITLQGHGVRRGDVWTLYW